MLAILCQMVFANQSIFKNLIAIRKIESQGGLFALWLRFGSVTGFCKPAASPKPRQSSKILAPNGDNIFSNALYRKSGPPVLIRWPA
jgi:hypothetical protein